MNDMAADLGHRLRTTAESYGTSFEDMTMGEIAEATGVPRATLYYNFRSKEQVLAFLLTSMLEDITVRVEAAAAIEGDIRSRLANVVRAQLEAMAANPATTQLLVANLGRAGKLPDIAAGIDRAFRNPVETVITEGVESATIRAVDPALTATAIFGAVTVVGLYTLMLQDHLDVDQAVEGLLVLWGGLAP